MPKYSVTLVLTSDHDLVETGFAANAAIEAASRYEHPLHIAEVTIVSFQDWMSTSGLAPDSHQEQSPVASAEAGEETQ